MIRNSSVQAVYELTGVTPVSSQTAWTLEFRIIGTISGLNSHQLKSIQSPPPSAYSCQRHTPCKSGPQGDAPSPLGRDVHGMSWWNCLSCWCKQQRCCTNYQSLRFIHNTTPFPTCKWYLALQICNVKLSVFWKKNSSMPNTVLASPSFAPSVSMYPEPPAPPQCTVPSRAPAVWRGTAPSTGTPSWPKGENPMPGAFQIHKGCLTGHDNLKYYV